MNRIIKLLSVFLIFDFFLVSFPVYAANLNNLGLNLPNIQSVNQEIQSNKSNPISSVMEFPVDADNYKVGPGDTLDIHVIVGETALSINHSLLVGADGKIFFPNIGEIYLSGLSLSQSKKKIDTEIKKIYNEPYKLYVLLNQPKKVKIYLSGMVKSPGPIEVYDGSRISEVLDEAGGVASGGSNRYVYIKRIGADGKEGLIKADLFKAYRSKDLSKDIQIEARDIVEVPDANDVLISSNKNIDENDKLLFEGKETFIYIYGAVNKGGRFEFIPGHKLSDYLSYADGPTNRALLGSVGITRQVGGKAQKLSIDASDILYNGNSKNDVEIFGGDVINVPVNFFYFSDFSSFASMIFTGLALYNTFVK